MLVEKAQARLQKAAGTPGFPNRKLELKAMPPACDPDSKLGLAAVSDDQVAYDRFNARRTDEADPRRRQDVAAAAQARELARRARPALPSRAASENPWARLDKAIRATDQVLQSGGFRVVVLDLASVPAEQAYRIPAATWFRFRRAAQLGDAVLLLLTEQPCARSSAACVLACAPGHSADLLGTLSQTAEVARQRSGAMPPLRKAPGRAATWDAVPQWMRAAGE
jgi:recombination protein RecA